jgi:ribosomal protein S12 methylthiotransferase
MTTARRSYYIQSLGCNKNTVDSELIMSMLRERGYVRVDEPSEASRIIVNTCAFIDKAKQEAIDTVLALSRYRGEESALVVTGCMSQLYTNEIRKMIPEADIVTGTGNLAALIDAIDSEPGMRQAASTVDVSGHYSQRVMRTEFLHDRPYAYVKISEGCNRSCSFCLIPKIKGALRSRSVGEILLEAQHLEDSGIRELVLTSQDTLAFGRERHEREDLRLLLKELLDNTAIPFIRLLYLRPSEHVLNLLDLFDNGRLLPYFDIPVQHASERVLKLMKRTGNARTYEDLLRKIRAHIPHAVLRTTLITGFPGEGKREFEELLSFVERIKFNHVGVFVFSPQRETAAYSIRGRVRKSVAERRKDMLLLKQKGISHEILHAEIGNIHDVLIEESIQNENLYLGRSYHFAPEVDGLFVVQSRRHLEPGDIVKVRVDSSEDYDLHGSVQYAGREGAPT